MNTDDAYEISKRTTKGGSTRFYRIRGRNRLTGLLQWVLMSRAVAELDLGTGAAVLVERS